MRDDPTPPRQRIVTTEDATALLSILRADALNEPPVSALEHALRLGRTLTQTPLQSGSGSQALTDLAAALGAIIARLVQPNPDLALAGLRDDSVASELLFATDGLQISMEIAPARNGNARLIGEVLNLTGGVVADARIRVFSDFSQTAHATSMRAFPTETADAGSRAASASTSSPSESMTRSGSAHCASISRRASGCAVIQASRVMIGEVDKLVYSIVSGRSAIASPPQITSCQ